VRHQDPEDTLQFGLAVCAGYAGLYEEIAYKAGLECVVVGGHGKGYGHTELSPGQACPTESQGHAWNADKIDFGGPEGNGRWYWKLIDPCWGAGHLSNKMYQKAFNSRQFTDNNMDFGRKHFPQDRQYQYREDGRTISWQEYFVGETGGPGPNVFGNVPVENGIDTAKFLPKTKVILTDPRAHADTGGIVRFQFQRICDHWDPNVNGVGPDPIYAVRITENGNQRQVPFDTNGTYWWCDVKIDTLGKKGDTVTVWKIDTLNGKDTRGMAKDVYIRRSRNAASGFSGLAAWELG